MGRKGNPQTGTVPPRPALALLLAGLAFVLAPHLVRLPPWVGGLCAALVVWRGLRDLRGWPLPPRWLRLALTFAGVGVVVATYRTLLGPAAGVALLAVMVCLKLLELRQVRDAAVVVFLGYFLVVGAFLFDRSLWAGAYLVAAAVLLTAALTALSHPGATAGRWGHYLRTAGRLTLQAVPLAVLLFLLFPRIPGPLWHLPEQTGVGRTGLSESMEPGSITQLVESGEVAFRAQFAGEPPSADALYWRGPVLWRTDGRRWERAPPWAGEAPPVRGEGRAVEYTVTLEPHDKRWLFALDLPTRTPADAARRPGQELLAEEPIRALRRDTFRSALEYAIAPPTPLQRQMALALPEDRNPRARALARRWRTEGLAGRALVERALDHFRGEDFYYTRQPPPLGREAVDDFLFGSRRGFCEHYAAAFTTLMRAAGLPARVVTGYQGGEYNPVGDYLVVRQSNAHAWSEVWLEDAGWLRVDPTRVVPGERVEAAADQTRFRSTTAGGGGDAGWWQRAVARLRLGWDAVDHAWNQWVLGYDQTLQRRLLQWLGFGDGGWQALGGLLGGGFAVVVMALGAWLFLRRPPATDPVAAAYGRFCRRLARAGVVRSPDEGPRDYARRVARARPDLARVVGEVTRLYTDLRYAGRGGGAKRRRLDRLVRGFRPRKERPSVRSPRRNANERE